MKALSIKQPWAWLVSEGYKGVENRTWKTNYRGVFLIHAGKEIDFNGIEWRSNTRNNDLHSMDKFVELATVDIRLLIRAWDNISKNLDFRK